MEEEGDGESKLHIIIDNGTGYVLMKVHQVVQYY